MSASVRILHGRYVDSVVLMRLASDLTAAAGIEDAAAVMGTNANLALLAEGEFLEGPVDAGPNDLVIAVKAASAAAADAAFEQVEALLAPPVSARGAAPAPRTLADAVAIRPSANVAVVSLPGEHAGAEARRALDLGLNVFLFSSNVPLEQEIELKHLAASRGLLCMGPDCGTSIIGGAGLGFANAVRRGPVGVVGSSGTGIQAVTTILDHLGTGVSHAIGCGSRDMSEPVGAMTALAGVDLLLADERTEALVLLSKPVAPVIAARLRARLAGAAKPVIFGFLGDPESPPTLEAIARAAAEAVGVEVPDEEPPIEHRPGTAASQRWIRGLYAGGTLAYEAQLVLRAAGLTVASNAPLPGALRLSDTAASSEHTILDLGSEELTRGRPHPMIDSRVRRARLLEEARDPEVAVVLLDFVLGYGAAADPAGDLAGAIKQALSEARDEGRELTVLAYVCGTERDPQRLGAQMHTLEQAGAVVLASSAGMAGLAVSIVSEPVGARR